MKTEKRVLVFLGVDPVCCDWKGFPVAFSLDTRLTERRKVTSDAVNLVRSPWLRRS